MTRNIDALIAEALVEAPLPTSIDDLDVCARRTMETQAAKAGMTPAAFFTLSRARSGLSAVERYEARHRDAALADKGLAPDGTPRIDGQSAATLDARAAEVVAAIRGRAK